MAANGDVRAGAEEHPLSADEGHQMHHIHLVTVDRLASPRVSSPGKSPAWV